jgi:hypothetical protein
MERGVKRDKSGGGVHNARPMRRLFALSIAAATALTARGAENVLLIVNADSWASTCIANEYAAARAIPPGNIVELRNLPAFERMNVDDFRERILLPALKAADERGIAPQLDYVLYSADLPAAIDVSSDMAGKQFPKIITQPAAINGLTFFYQFALAKNTTYLGLNANFYHRNRAQVAPEAPWPEADQQRYAVALAGLQKAGAAREKDPAAAVEEKALREAMEALTALKATHPKNTELLYNLGCAHALLGEPEPAVAALREAVQAGWWDMRHAQNDSDLRSVRDRDDFKQLATLARDVKFEQAAAGGFRGAAGWQPGGHLVPPDRGVRYLLSTMLACTSGRGNSVKEALSALKRSVAADGTHPPGSIYYLQNGDVRSTTREWGFDLAVQELRALGVSASVEKGVLPQNKRDVAGATIGSAGFEWAKSGSTILPGAICEHLTSCGGMMSEGDPQTPLTEFIRFGAAGASGTVVEPYAIQAKFPSPFIHWHYAQGCTLAEAYYLSVAGPYQLLIVGDALCAPWKKKFVVSAEGLSAGAVLKGVASVTPVAKSEDKLTPGSFALHLDGRRVAALKPGATIQLDTTRVPDGAHTFTVVGNTSDAIASQSELAIPVTVRNHGEELIVKAPSGEWAWDKPIEIKAVANEARAIVFRHHAREIARIPAADGTATLEARALGQGPVRLQPVALFEEGREVWGEPIDLRIVPPAALPSQEPGGPLEKGLAVTPASGTTAIAAKAEGDWLAKAGVPADGEFAVEAWFNVPETDVYQFQLHGPAELRVLVDGQLQQWPRGKEWWFVPVHLAAGSHRVRFEGKAAGAAKLEARFGGPGAQRLDGARFQHRP